MVKILTVVNLVEESGGYTQAELLAKYLGSPMINFLPVGRGDKVMQTEIDGIIAYYPAKSLYGAIKALAPDVLLVHTPSTNLCSELHEIKKLCKVIYVCHANLYEFLLTDSMRMYIKYMIYLMDDADLIISVSDEQRKLLEQITDNKIVMIPPAVEYEQLKRVETYPREKEFMLVGRLSPIKNHLTPIIAMKRISKEYPNSFLKIFGSGLLDTFYREILGVMKLESNVNLFNNVSHNEIITELCHSSALVNSSISENESVAILEAKALGIPVISGYSFSPEGYYKEMKDLIEDYDSFRRLAEGSRETIKSYDVENICKRYKKICQNVVVADVERK